MKSRKGCICNLQMTAWDLARQAFLIDESTWCGLTMSHGATALIVRKYKERAGARPGRAQVPVERTRATSPDLADEFRAFLPTGGDMIALNAAPSWLSSQRLRSMPPP